MGSLMTSRKKKVLLVTGIILAVFVIAVTAFIFLADINSYRPGIESAASDALGMDVRINGKMGITLVPGFGLSLRDVHIRNEGVDVISAEKVIIGLNIIPLLRREIMIREFGFIKPDFHLESDKTGKFNFEPLLKNAGQDHAHHAPFQVKKFGFSEGHLLYTDKKAGGITELKDCNLTMKDFLYGVNGQTDPFKNISFSGRMTCAKIKTKNAEVSNLRFDIKGKEGIVDIEQLTMDFFGGKEKGKIVIDMTKDIPHLRIQYTASKFRFEKFFERLSQKKIIKGEMNFSLDLSMKGKSFDEMKRTIDGEASLQGDNLLLYNLDLDRLISKIEESQNFSLIDVGAFFLAGPLGTLLTKGYDFAGAYMETGGGEGAVRRLVSRWKIRHGVAEAEDVALSTGHNRIALMGRLDFVGERFDDVTEAVVDAKGCVKFSQKINGPFRNPRVEKGSPVKSVIGPVVKLFEKTERLFKGGKCTVFYAGSVKHPE